MVPLYRWVMLRVKEPKVICGIDTAYRTEAAEHSVKTSSLNFFLLVFVLSVPFYILGATGAQFPGMTFLPASALMGFVPIVTALILIYRQDGDKSAIALLKSSVAYGRNLSAAWILTVVLFMPIVSLFEFAILRLMGSAMPIPQIEFGRSLFYFAAFFIGAIGEELGWQGYAYPRLRKNISIFSSALILGIIWALWHLIPFVQMGRSTDWIIWHMLSTVALRFIIVWLFESTGKSILIAVLFHAMINLTWALFPVAGSFYDPFVTFLILAFPVSAIIAWWRLKLNFGDKTS